MDSPKKEQESSSSSTPTSGANPMQGGGPAPADHHHQQPKRPHLSIDIPTASTAAMPRHPVIAPTAAAAEHPAPAAEADTIPTTPGSHSSSGRTPGSCKPPPAPQRTPSFKLRQTVRSLLPGGGSFKSSVRGYEASFSRLFSARIARTSSLPVNDDDNSVVSGPNFLSLHGADKTPSDPAVDKAGMHRSQSLPMNMKKFNSAKSIKRMNSLGGVYRVVPSTPRNPATPSNVVPDIEPTESGPGEEDGEDIAEEEAVCRICMVELSEGSGTMKLECACKGELALAHKDCALKWFSIKGTRTCEVCKVEVQNLPVTLLRVQSVRAEASRGGNGGANGPQNARYRLWHGTPILVIVSILAYFCFLEQLLVGHNGFAALAISLPFSCILGLFSSLTTSSMVARRYVWIYGAIQFLFVVFFTHLFYRYLHLQAVISIILATFAGFGVGMIGNSIIVEILRWRTIAPAQQRRARRPRVAQQQQQQAPASSQPTGQPSATQEGQRNAAGGDVENPVVPQE
ncbi:uncharacterized protein LOC124674257 [Lolium rigidum]|uniref:uncharacterized protein LOC124674257 n=1 Tax=Lolium rigidum TaxID=89674 RepID=UPI001F5CE321|nr:uncharacterized protein LOC124674257 [Lolium rigidum]